VVKLLLLRSLMRAFSWMGPRAAAMIAPLLAAPLWLLSARKRRATRTNLEAAYPQMDHRQLRRIAHASMVHYVRGVIETGMLWHWPPDKILRCFVESEDLEVLQAARRGGRGVIVAAPHFGAWELLGQYLHRHDLAAALYKPGRQPAIESLLLEKRVTSGGVMVPATAPGLRQFYRLLEAGETVMLLPDQEPSLGAGRFAPFYGIEALSSVLLPRLAQKTGATIVWAVCERRPKGRYRVRLFRAGTDLYSEDLRTALTAMNRDIERCIEVDTRQYLWAYKRFRTRPPGEPPFYGPSRHRR